MTNFQPAVSTTDSVIEKYSVRQRLLSASLSLAMTAPVTVTYALANAPAPALMPTAASSAAGSNAGFSHTALSHTGFSLTHSAVSAMGAANHAAAATSAAAHLQSISSFASPSLHALTGSTSSSLLSAHNAKGVVQSAAAKAVGADDLNLASATPLFAAGGLAGFHNLTLVIGGKVEQVSFDTKLTAAELVAAQQVLSGTKQAITINANGVATGGTFDLTNSSLSALDGAIGGNLGSLVISHGVHAVDSLSSLNLSGTLVNLGSLVLGTDGGAKSQSVDTISAGNIYNGVGGVISSSALGALAPAGIALSATGAVYNSGVISSSSTLSIAAPTIVNAVDASSSAVVHAQPTISAVHDVSLTTQSLTNSGLIASSTGNVNVFNGGGNNNIAVDGSGGTIAATKGNINFNESGYSGSGNVTLNGGNYLSNQLNLNAGTGAINASVDQISGQVNGAASSSHVTAATDNLDLGTICVSGDPTYFNTAGDITITGALTGDPDIAIIASGNIIGNGGSLDTSQATVAKTIVGTTNGGDILLVAGAEFSVNPTTNVGNSTATATNGDTTSVLTVTGNKSATGGYIDLSGIVYTGSTKNTSLTNITTNGGSGAGGNITMVAYQGTGKFSGGIIGTSANGGDGAVIDTRGGTSNGNITLIGGGAPTKGFNPLFLYVAAAEGGNLSITGGTPTLSGGAITIKDGAVTSGGTYGIVAGSESNSTALVGNTILSGGLTIDTAGSAQISNGSIAGNLNIKAGTSIDLAQIVTAANATLVCAKGGVFGDSLSTAGAAGTPTSVNGGNGGTINITANTISLNFIDSSGGGGAGGSSALNSAGAGGRGGNAGAITLISTTGSIEVGDWINASGGGGGGGAGAAAGSGNVGGAGGAGGGASAVIIKAATSYIASEPSGYSVLDFDGAAGGAGGSSVLSSAVYVPGGGGGGGTAFGGGGGGGAAGVGGTGAVGGGGGGVYYLAAGGGGAGTGASTTTATGGSGGTQKGGFEQIAAGGAGGVTSPADNTLAGTAGGVGITNNGNSNSQGGNGGRASLPNSNTGIIPTPDLGGRGGSKDAPGLGGANGGVAGIGSGASGGNTTTEFGSGSVNLTVNATSGTAAKPLVIDTPSLTITGGSITSGTKVTPASIYVASGGQSVNLKSATMVNGSTFSLVESHNVLTVSGPITGASTVDLDGWGGVVVNGAINAGSTVNITAGQNAIAKFSGLGGNIVASAIITAPTVNLTAIQIFGSGGAIAAELNATSVSTTAASTATLTLDTAAGKTTTLTQTSIGAGSGTLNLINNGAGSIATGKSITAGVINASSSTNTGSSISLITSAKAVNLDNLEFSNITVTDTYAGTGGTVVLGATNGNQVGSGNGVVTITTAASDIVQVTGAVVDASNVILSSKTGNVGTVANSIDVDTAALSASAAKGNVYISDGAEVTLGAGSALNTYQVFANGITVAGAITGGTSTTGSIDLVASSEGVTLDANVGAAATRLVNIEGNLGINQNAKAVVSGNGIVLKSVANAGGIGNANQYVFTKAASTLEIDQSGTSGVFVNQNGKAQFVGSSGANATLNLIDQSALSITGTVAYNTTNITAPSVTLAAGLASNGSISGTNVTITSPLLTVGATSTIAVTGSATFNSATTLTIVGTANTINPGSSLTLGGTVNGKTTSAITLGDKTGANNPLQSYLANAAGDLTNLTVNTTGNFTSGMTGIAVGPQAGSGAGGTINFTAKNFVTVSSSPLTYAPVTLTANPGNASDAGGNISLTLTGTQNVNLSTAAGNSKTGAPYVLTVNSGSANPGDSADGSISVSSNGVLTVATNDAVNAATGSGGGTINLSGAKGLAVNTDLFNTSQKLQTISLNSGAKTPFALDAGGTAVVNGTIDSVNAQNININAAGVIQTPTTANSNAINATTELGLSNSAGTLVVSGEATGSIDSAPMINLSAKSGITLGDAKTGMNNPLSFINTTNLTQLTVSAGAGVFSSNITNFAASYLQFSATNVVVPGVAGPLLTFSGSNPGNSAGSVYINITGTQGITLSPTAISGSKVPVYLVTNLGNSNSGATNITTAGILTINAGGLTAATNSILTLSGGKGLAVTDSALFTTTDPSTLTLTSGATTPLTIGSGGSTTNSIIGNVQGGAITINSLAGITVANGSSINADGAGGSNNIALTTKSFINNGTVQTLNGGADLTFTAPGTNGLTIVNGTNASYSGISFTNLTAGGNVNLGNLFTSGSLLDASSGFSIITPGSVTFGGTMPGTTLGNNATIDIQAGSLVSKNAPIVFTATGNTSDDIDIQTKSAIVIGMANGNISIGGAPGSVELTSTGGAVTVNSAISSGIVQMQGTSVTLNANVTANGTVRLASTSTSGAITTSTGTSINTQDLYLDSMNTKLSALPITVKVTDLVYFNELPGYVGAFNVNNTNGSPNVLVTGSGAALTYTGQGKTYVDNLATSKGSINVNTLVGLIVEDTIQAVGGGVTFAVSGISGTALNVNNNTSITTSGGSITLLNSSPAAQNSISIGLDVNIHASSTVKGVGQVSIVVGTSVPTASQLAAGSVPGPTSPTIITSGGATVTYGTTTNPTESITVSGPSTLNAAGRNVVFDGGGASNSIVLQGNDVIVADPPVGGSAMNAAVVYNAASITVPSIAAQPLQATQTIQPTQQTSSLSQLSTAAVTGPAFTPNQNYSQTPTNANNNNGLSGGVSNVVERNLQSGSMFIAPDVNTTVRTGFGVVNVAAGSVALVVAFEGGVAVYNLHDNKRNSIVIESSGHRVSVAPGRNAVLTSRNVHYFEEVNPAEFVSYRRMTGKSFDDGIKSFQSEFDVRTMLQGVAPLKDLLRSDDTHSRKVANSLLKTTAILMTLSDATPFEPMVAPRLTAMNQ